MVQFYVLQIKLGRLRLENVPERWHADVAAALAEEGGA